MNREELIDLADKILRKEASEAEISMYNAWYNSFQQADEIPVLDEAAKKSVLYSRIVSVIDDKVPVSESKANTYRLKFSVWAAVAAVAIFTLCIYFFNSSFNTDKSKVTGLVASAIKIKPGGNTAKLTLANGKSIALSDQKTGVVIDVAGLKYTDETTIESSSINGNKNGLMSIVTPRGGTYQVLLADGSKVWLNAESSIKFPTSFAGQQQRAVELVGEAYFEIAKNKHQKFIVKTQRQHVEVLGTHFNINSYHDESNVITTLLEGAVQIFVGKGNKESVVLKPGEQSAVSQSRTIDVNDVDVNDVVAWKDGKFVFVHENVRSIMNKIARWYDVDIVYEGDVTNKALGGSVSRFKEVEEVLEMLSDTKAVQFRIDGKKVIVMPYKDK